MKCISATRFSSERPACHSRRHCGGSRGVRLWCLLAVADRFLKASHRTTYIHQIHVCKCIPQARETEVLNGALLPPRLGPSKGRLFVLREPNRSKTSASQRSPPSPSPKAIGTDPNDNACLGLNLLASLLIGSDCCLFRSYPLSYTVLHYPR